MFSNVLFLFLNVLFLFSNVLSSFRTAYSVVNRYLLIYLFRLLTWGATNRDMSLFMKSRLWGCYKTRHVTKRDVLLLATLRYIVLIINFIFFEIKTLSFPNVHVVHCTNKDSSSQDFYTMTLYLGLFLRDQSRFCLANLGRNFGPYMKFSDKVEK
jgi:hypothetical protein